MTYLDQSRDTVEALTPGLLAALTDIEFATREQAGSPALELFRRHRGGQLLLPREFGGLEADACTAIRFQVGLGRVAPSVAVGTTMHQYKVVMIERLLEGAARKHMLEGFGEHKWLVASCGAESGYEKTMFKPSVEVEVLADAVRVTGVKRPCSLSASMDLLSTMISGPAGTRFADEILNVLIPAEDPGISRHPFWGSPIFAGAENGEVRFTNIVVPDAHIIRCGTAARPDPAMRLCFVWFELLITAAYLGIASELVGRALERTKVSASLRARLASELELCGSALEGLGIQLGAGEVSEALLARTLQVRYAVQDAIERMSGGGFEALGGSEFQKDGEIAYRLAACRCLAFHPPQRDAMASSLIQYFAGAPLELV